MDEDPLDRLPARARKGRGAVGNVAARFEPTETVAVDDGWRHEGGDGAQEDAPRLETVVLADTAKSVIAWNESPDVGFDRSINPYRGCEHGCIYCYARPSHAYLGLSPGLDFETKLFAKHDAPALLERELARPGYRPAVIALGANTDCYQPIEREHRITRGVLEVLARWRHPVALITKSALVARDIDILAPMAALKLASVTVSVTTLDPELARRMEPRAATPPRRLDAIRRLAEAGIPVGVNVSPVIVGLTDHEMEGIMEAARAAGASHASYLLVRLPLELKELFQDWLAAHVPDRAQRVLSLIRQTRGGALYRSGFGERMKGEGPVAELVGQRFRVAARRLGFTPRGWDMDTSLFRRPPADARQMTLDL